MSSIKLQNNITKNHEGHPFHVVVGSSLPIGVSVGSGMLLAGLTFFMHEYATLADVRNDPVLVLYKWASLLYDLHAVRFGFIFFLGLLIGSIVHWILYVLVESSQGYHTKRVRYGLKLGGILFIVSEAMFFVSFFWGLFHLATIASIGPWPPKGIQVINPFHLPLANTVILLSSGVCTVWAHRAILAGMRNDALDAIWAACTYGFLFTWLQFIEYGLTNFSINDGAYGSIFFMATGFHGIHVMIGTVFLFICYLRLSYLPEYFHNKGNVTDYALRFEMTAKNHVGFEFAAWYWHFVDVVWLFLYFILYMWASF